MFSTCLLCCCVLLCVVVCFAVREVLLWFVWCLLFVVVFVVVFVVRVGGGTPLPDRPPPDRPKFRSFSSLSRHRFAFFVSLWVSSR